MVSRHKYMDFQFYPRSTQFSENIKQYTFNLSILSKINPVDEWIREQGNTVFQFYPRSTNILLCGIDPQNRFLSILSKINRERSRRRPERCGEAFNSIQDQRVIRTFSHMKASYYMLSILSKINIPKTKTVIILFKYFQFYPRSTSREPMGFDIGITFFQFYPRSTKKSLS